MATSAPPNAPGAAESADAPSPEPPGGVLFVCTHNAIRSPMAGALYAKLLGGARPVATAGVHSEGLLDPFAAAVLREIGLDISSHHPQTLADIEARGGDVAAFEAIVALSAEAAERAQAYGGPEAPVEFWDAPDPTQAGDDPAERLAACRRLRETLSDRIRRRFSTAAQRPD
ncbi:MAG: low molecular weight phosphatase family protein [Pseudomonadota bacterium]